MYFKEKNEASREEKSELTLNPQHEGREIDISIVQGSEMEDASPDPGMSKPIHLST